jgi:rSAM/selenodomain-associated transferase 2
MVFTFPVLAVEQQTGVFQEIYMVKPLIYLPFVALLVHAWRRPDEDWSRDVHPATATVAAVIPTLNEGADVAAAIRSLHGQTGIAEIVVADGGSTDTTVQQAREAGARVVEATRGRGPQICAGIAITHADVILVLHADSRLRPGAVERMMIRLNAYPGAPGGAFGMHFDGRARFTRFIAGLNHLRILTTGISFGDQGQFIRRSALEAVGGFPACMLMEDVELSLRMKQIGRPLCIADGIRVSDRRWRREGRGRNVVMVIGLFVHYLARRRWRGDAGDGRVFYRRYYRRHQA